MGTKPRGEFASKNTIFRKEEYDKIMTRHATNRIFQWLDRSSRGYWDFVSRVAGYFPECLRRVRHGNPFVGIAHLAFVFVAGFIVVTPLYLLIGPLVQIALVIIAVIWTCLAGIFGWHRAQE